MLTTRGAVQQVHIIVGSDANPPAVACCHVPLRRSTRSSHRRGSNESTAAATSRLTTSAFQTACV